MDLHTILASGSNVETLKCFVCENYLSYFPISLCSNSRSICGRCVVPEGINSLQDPAFETVVEHLKFPCRYESEGCFEDLQPKDVPQHEKTCPLRIVKCVVNEQKSCDWSGSLPTLIDHCQKEHSEMFLKSGELEMDLTRSVEHQHLMEVDDRLFIFQKKFDVDSKILTCAVYPNEYETDAESHCCELGIRKGKTSIVHEFATISFGEKFVEEIYLQFARKPITDDEDLVTVKLSIGKKRIENELENETKMSELRDHLKCASCGNMAGPSVFRDSRTMTVLCANASCSADSSKNSNKVEDQILSKVVTVLKCPCRFQEYGCTYAALFEEVKSHQNFCQYRKEICFYSDCQWEGLRKDTENHILEEHPSKIVTKEAITLSSSEPRTYFTVVQFKNRLFRMNCSVEARLVLWSVLQVAICKEKYNFELEVVDASEPNGIKRHVMTKRCGQLTEKAEHFPANADYCELPKEQVFGNSESAKFKCRIFSAL